MTLRGELLTDLSSLAALRPAWDNLHRQSRGGPFSSMDWILAWVAAFGGPEVRPAVGLVWQGDQLAAGAVMGLQSGRVSAYGPTVQKLKLLCNDRAGFHEVLALPGLEATAMPELLNLFHDQGRWTLADLTPMHPSPALDAFLAAGRARGLVDWHRHEITRTVCDMSQGWEAYLDRHSRNFRKSLRTVRKKIDEAGGTLRILRGTDPDAAEILDRVMDLSARCWKARSGTDIGTNPTDRKFISEIWDRFSARNAMRILLVSIGGQDAASAFLLREGNREYGWISDFDERFAEFSPGRHVIALSLKTAAADGVEILDFMRATPFTERFADTQPTFERIRLCRPYGVPRLWLSLEEHLRPLGKEFRRRYRHRTRKRVAFRGDTPQPRELEQHDD